MSLNIEFKGFDGQTYRYECSKKSRTFTIRENTALEIDLAQLSPISDLREIDLADNRIKTLDLLPTSGFEYLTSLNLSDNELEHINLKPLSKCLRLESLDLSLNHLLKLNLSPLAKCRSLKELSISDNFLKELDLTPLDSCTRLESISLFTNDIEVLDMTSIIKLPRLKTIRCDQHLDIRANPIYWKMRVAGDSVEKETGARVITFNPLSPPSQVSTHDSQPDQRIMKEILKCDEDQITEFKSSFQLDTKDNTLNKELKYAVIRTVCGFMNAKGGVLLIGVEDDKKIYGIEEEMKRIKGKNHDGYELILRQEIDNAIGRKNETLVGVDFEPWGDKEICRVSVPRSLTGPVFLKPKKGEEEFLLRSGNRTKKLTGYEMIDYIRETWPELFVKSTAVDDE